MSSDKNLTGFQNLSGLGQNIYLKAAAINRAMLQSVYKLPKLPKANYKTMNVWICEQNYKNEQLMFMPVLSFTGINSYSVFRGKARRYRERDRATRLERYR